MKKKEDKWVPFEPTQEPLIQLGVYAQPFSREESTMTPQDLTRQLSEVANGRTTVTDAQKQLSDLTFESLEYARIDHHRSLRKGFTEVIFGLGKTRLWRIFPMPGIFRMPGLIQNNWILPVRMSFTGKGLWAAKQWECCGSAIKEVADSLTGFSGLWEIPHWIGKAEVSSKTPVDIMTGFYRTANEEGHLLG